MVTEKGWNAREFKVNRSVQLPPGYKFSATGRHALSQFLANQYYDNLPYGVKVGMEVSQRVSQEAILEMQWFLLTMAVDPIGWVDDAVAITKELRELWRNPTFTQAMVVGGYSLSTALPFLSTRTAKLARAYLEKGVDVAKRAGKETAERVGKHIMRKGEQKADDIINTLEDAPKSGTGFSRYVEAEKRINRTPQTLAEIEDQIRLNAGTADINAQGVPRTNGRFGTRAHSNFEQLNNQLNQELQASGSRYSIQVEEFRDIQGVTTGRRAGNSMGTDIVVYDQGVPVAGYDLKTGRPWSPVKLQEVQRRFGVPVIQIQTR